MSKISIDVTPEDHERLKVLAALEGVSLKNYLLSDKLPDSNAITDLETLLNNRIEHHESSNLKGRASARAILDDLLAKR